MLKTKFQVFCTSRQKLDIIKLKLSKNVNNKTCDPKLILFNEIFFRKIRTIFDVANWLGTSEFCDFFKIVVIDFE